MDDQGPPCSIRALTLRPGDLIAVTYLKEGLIRAPFRVVKLSPSMNFRRVLVSAQLHSDEWYSDDPTNTSGGGRQPGAGVHAPLPLVGPVFNQNGATDFVIRERTSARTDGGATVIVSVDYVEPVVPSPSAPALPLLSLSPGVTSTGGSLKGGMNYYYAVSSETMSGNQGMLSFTIRAAVPEGSDANAVTIERLSFPTGAASFSVYRGTTPQLLYSIAKDQAIAAAFTDTGLPLMPIGPPDVNYHHSNFYYRLELAGPMISDSLSATTIGRSDMNATALVYSGMTVRIIEGKGVGQERRITTNDETTLTVSPAWLVVPDSTSQFVIVESTWRFGAISMSSPAEFEVPNVKGTVVQVSGRSANVHDRESAVELSPLTRWIVGGGSGDQLDSDVSGAPSYVLSPSGQGNLTISQVGFGDLANTRSVTAGTLQLVYLDELQTTPQITLTQPIDNVTTDIVLNGSVDVRNAVVQLEEELVIVVSPGNDRVLTE